MSEVLKSAGVAKLPASSRVALDLSTLSRSARQLWAVVTSVHELVAEAGGRNLDHESSERLCSLAGLASDQAQALLNGLLDREFELADLYDRLDVGTKVVAHA